MVGLAANFLADRSGADGFGVVHSQPPASCGPVLVCDAAGQYPTQLQRRQSCVYGKRPCPGNHQLRFPEYRGAQSRGVVLKVDRTHRCKCGRAMGVVGQRFRRNLCQLEFRRAKRRRAGGGLRRDHFLGRVERPPLQSAQTIRLPKAMLVPSSTTFFPTISAVFAARTDVSTADPTSCAAAASASTSVDPSDSPKPKGRGPRRAMEWHGHR